MVRGREYSRCGSFSLSSRPFGISGMMAVDWGLAVHNRRDLPDRRLDGDRSGRILRCDHGSSGGRPHLGSRSPDPASGSIGGLVEPPTFHHAVYHGLPGIMGGVILLLFGLATLAPACYAAWISSHRFAAHWPGLRRLAWTWIASAPVFLLIVTSWAGHLELIISVLGAFFAPAVGAMVADAILHHQRWNGVRLGWHFPGIAAWAVGVVVGLVPVVGPWLGWSAAVTFQPASLYAFLVAQGLFLRLLPLRQPVRPSVCPRRPRATPRIVNNQRSLIWHFWGLGCQGQISRSPWQGCVALTCDLATIWSTVVPGANGPRSVSENGTKCHFLGGISSVCTSVCKGSIRPRNVGRAVGHLPCLLLVRLTRSRDNRTRIIPPIVKCTARPESAHGIIAHFGSSLS